MGRPEEPLERDGTPLREFAFWLRDLRSRAGLTYEQLRAQTHYATSTVQAATAGQRLPTLRVTLAFVAACGGDRRAWQEYWTRIRRMLDEGAPQGISRSVTPPWLDSTPERAGAAGTAAGQAAHAVGEPEGWFIESFIALVRVDADPVEVIERRTIVATADGLGEVVTSVSVPRHPDDIDRTTALESELLYGGSLELRRHPYDSYFANVIVLPRPLRAGERHEYSIRLRIPPGQRMTPHFLHVPFRRSDHFDLRIRFCPRRPPRTVWLLDGAPTAMIYQPEPSARTLSPDRFGEVHVCFHDMRPGLGYGVRWREDDQKSTGLRPASRPPTGFGLAHGITRLTAATPRRGAGAGGGVPAP